MHFDKLKHSVTLNSENSAFQVPEGMQLLTENYTFSHEGRNYLVHLYPNNKMVVSIAHDGKTTIISNCELTKIDETTVDVHL